LVSLYIANLAAELTVELLPPSLLTRVAYSGCLCYVTYLSYAGTKVGLGPGHILLDEDPAPPSKGHIPQFLAHVYCGQTVAHLSYC